jgi:hypothetical protein
VAAPEPWAPRSEIGRVGGGTQGTVGTAMSQMSANHPLRLTGAAGIVLVVRVSLGHGPGH